MNRVLFTLVMLFVAEFVFAQGEIYANCFYQNTTGRVVIRLAIRNNTNSTTGQMKLAGMRFGFQFNDNAVSYAGYQSFMTLNGQPGSGLEDASYLSFIGPDTGPNAADIDSHLGSSRSARIVNSNDRKTMQIRYINRSTTNCLNTISVNPGEIKILLDIYFTLNHNNPAFYKLNTPTYGFGDPQFIAQFLEKGDGGHDGALTDINKEIVVSVIRQGNTDNPYQPFDAGSCTNNNVNPITINSNDINFVTPVNGILGCRFGNEYYVKQKQNANEVIWKVCHNELLNNIELRKRVGNGDFKTIDIKQAQDVTGIVDYKYIDNTNASNSIEKVQYQVILNGKDGSRVYGSILSINAVSLAPSHLDIFPNPAKEKIQFHLPFVSSGYQIRIFDLAGRILSNQVQNNGGNQQVILPLLSKGVYFIEAINNSTGQKLQSRFVKE
jgi:hypothetical protein